MFIVVGGCLEVTGRKHARFVKTQAGGIKQTSSSRRRTDGDHTDRTRRITQRIHVRAADAVMNSPTCIQDLLKIPFGGRLGMNCAVRSGVGI